MPIGFGMASSHAPNLFMKTYAGWQRLWDRFRLENVGPPEVADETPSAVENFVERTAAAFGHLRDALAAYEPDVLIVFAGDQNEWYKDANVPNLMIYAGEEDIVGFHNFGADDVEPRLQPWEHPERFGVRLKVDSGRAKRLLTGLVEAGFDVAISRHVPAPNDPRRGAPHALVRPLPLLLPRPDLPIIPVMLKTVERSPAILNGSRCLELGRAIATICEAIPGRIAVYGSGGLSHDPLGPRAGWVDEPLDRWVLQQLADGTPHNLGSLYAFRSAATESGTGEIRTWLAVAGAIDQLSPGVRANVIDYFPARKSTTGCGWAVWPELTKEKEHAA